MVKFLTTTGVSHELEELIKGAQERLVLISPFLRVNARIRDLLADKALRKFDTRIIYGKSELDAGERGWLSTVPSIRVSYCERLHAKCYLSEQRALLTSMNLYEFSQVNNIEMGVLIDRQSDEALYDDIYQETLRIVRGSEEGQTALPADTAQEQHQTLPAKRPRRRAGDTPRQRKRARPNKATVPDHAPPSGFCVRCRTALPANPDKPYCAAHYKSWKRYNNRDYTEKYCHLCGEPHGSTLRLPVCGACHAKHKTHFAFSSA